MRHLGQEPISCFCSVRRLDVQIHPLYMTLVCERQLASGLLFFSISVWIWSIWRRMQRFSQERELSSSCCDSITVTSSSKRLRKYECHHFRTTYTLNAHWDNYFIPDKDLNVISNCISTVSSWCDGEVWWGIDSLWSSWSSTLCRRECHSLNNKSVFVAAFWSAMSLRRYLVVGLKV